AGVLRRLPAALPGGGTLPRAYRALGGARRPGPHQGTRGGGCGESPRPACPLPPCAAIRAGGSLGGARRRGRGACLHHAGSRGVSAMDGGIATAWVGICALEEIPRQGARVVATERYGEVAVFRTLDDTVFALEDRCPHKGGRLSQGIVHGHAVTCPLHSW